MPVILWLVFSIAALCADRGIVVAASDRYVPALERHLSWLRNRLQCELPCEIWHAGDELSTENQKKLKAFSHVVICNLMDYESGAPEVYRGWQMKGLMLNHTEFEEVIIMDADLVFFQNPEILFQHEGYIETGAFFFRDRRIYVVPFQFSGIHNQFAEMRGNLSFYWKQSSYFKKLIEKPSKSMPLDWRHHWGGEKPSEHHLVTTEKQEAGCVVIDKRRHREGVLHIYQLNQEYEKTYRFVWGDKETYWMGFEMAKEPYYVNSDYPWTLQNGKEKVDIVQFVEGKLFYQQKWPIALRQQAFFKEYFLGKRDLYEDELDQFNDLHQFYCPSTSAN